MELRHLNHFLTVLETGSLGRAARVLNISEPALSKSIRRLEDSLQVRLLDRGPHGMTPTEFGRSLATHAKLVRSEIDHAVSEIDELRGLSRGVVHVGIGPSFATTIMPRAVARLQATRPGLHVVVRQGLVDLVPGVIHGDLDLIFVTLEDEPPDDSLEQSVIMDDRLVVVARRDHPFAKKRRIGKRDLAGATWVLSPRPDPVRLQFDKMARRKGIGPLNVAAESSSITFLNAYVRETDALSFLPEPVIQPEIDRQEMTLLAVDDFAWQRKVGVVRRKRATLSPACDALIAEVRIICRPQSGGKT